AAATTTTWPCSVSSTTPSVADRRAPATMASMGARPRPRGADMDVELSAEQEEFRKIVRAFAEGVVAPRPAGVDREASLDRVVLAQMAGMGLFGLPFPEEVGGMGADYTTLCLAIEELARVDSSVAITLEAAVGLAAMPIWRYGTSEQHQRWLRPLATGERLGAFGPHRHGGRRA